MIFDFRSGNEPEPDDGPDPESVTFAYGFRVGEVVMYRSLIQGKIVEFGQNADVVIVPWDPDNKAYTGDPMRVAVNECE